MHDHLAPPVRLSAASLPALRDRLAVPAYDRSALQVGIVHVGVGGFHRAHEARYLDRLMNDGKALDWAVCGVGVLPSDRLMRDVLAEQGGLYTLVEKHADGTYDARVVGSIVDVLFAPDDPERVVEQMADPRTRIVSLTITEGGYALAAQDGPASAFALVLRALVRRRERGLEPFTVMSCDNIAGNGQVARRSLAAYAARQDPALGDWVGAEVAFPDSMVDRITPVTTPQDRAEVTARFGVQDRWPVVCEPFSQWVLEDVGTARPPWQDAGVQLVPDVGPYELMKLRLLNASHQALCYLGHLAGYRLVHDVCRDPLFSDFLLAYMDEEATPTLEPVPGIDLVAYKHELIARFSNAEVRDTVARLCAESSDRIPTWLLPVIRHNLAHGGKTKRAVTVVAAWARYAEGVDEQGEPIEVVDRHRDALVERARRYREDPLAFVRDHALFGDLAEDPRFTSEYLEALASLHAVGARRTLERL